MVDGMLAGRGQEIVMPVRRDKHGRWHFRVTVRLPDGTRRRISGWPGTPGPFHDLSRTKLGAEEAEQRAIAEARTGKPASRQVPPAKEAQTIQIYATETFVETYIPTLTKPSARRSLRQILTTHVLPVFGHLRLDQIRQEHVDAFVGAEKRRGASAKSINNRLAGLSSLLRYARDNGVVAAPAVRLRCKVPGMSAEIEAVPMDHVVLLLAVATDARYLVAVLLAVEAGLRAGEILGLTVRRSIDKDSGEVVAPKHDKRRTIPLPPRLLSALEALPKRGLWIVGRLDGDALGYYALHEAIVGLYDRAGAPRPSMPIHCLRHTYGTTMARQVPLPTLQRLMGHAQITTTMRYISVSEADERAAVASVFGSAWQPRGSEAPDKEKGA
jgi:integrase/recombinase XerC